MSGCRFVTNCSSKVPWDAILQEISIRPGTPVLPNKRGASAEYDSLFEMWDAAKFNYDSVKWINYYPCDYSVNIASVFEDILGVTHIRSWISRIDPGYATPWHYDVDDNESEYLHLGTLRRFICYIGEPAPGHISIVGDQNFYNEPSGNIYEWDHYKEWHAGANVGLVPKYQYNFLSYC